jgi:hypothetical protein
LHLCGIAAEIRTNDACAFLAVLRHFRTISPCGENCGFASQNALVPRKKRPSVGQCGRMASKKIAGGRDPLSMDMDSLFLKTSFFFSGEALVL